MENREICLGRRRRRTMEELLSADLTRKATRGWATTEAFPSPNLNSFRNGKVFEYEEGGDSILFETWSSVLRQEASA